MKTKKLTIQDLKEVAEKKGLDTSPKSVNVGNATKQFDRFELLKSKSKKLLSNI